MFEAIPIAALIKLTESATGYVLKNFALLTGKDLCWSIFFIKLQSIRPATLSKKRQHRLQHRHSKETPTLQHRHLLRNLCETLIGVFHIMRSPKVGEGRGQAKCVRLRTRGRGSSRLRTYPKKIFCTTKSQNLFVVQKKLLHCNLLLCIEKCKPALNNK